MIHGLFGFDGPVDMLACARRATQLEEDGNTPWYAVANTALGHASYVVGDPTPQPPRFPRLSTVKQPPL